MHSVKRMLVAVTVFGISSLAMAEEVKLTGATTTIAAVIKPHQDAVEQATGHTLTVVGNGTGKGLVALADGQCDAALASEPMEIAVEAAKGAGRELNAKELQLHQIGEQEIQFVVHPSNSVSALTKQQIKDIHTGKISNWKEVGGADLAISVFTDTTTGGTYAMVKRISLDGEAYAAASKALEGVKFVAANVGETPGGFGAVGAAFVNTKVVKVIETQKLVRPLSLITKGDPSPKVKQVIDALRKEAKAGK